VNYTDKAVCEVCGACASPSHAPSSLIAHGNVCTNPRYSLAFWCCESSFPSSASRICNCFYPSRASSYFPWQKRHSHHVPAAWWLQIGYSLVSISPFLPVRTKRNPGANEAKSRRRCKLELSPQCSPGVVILNFQFLCCILSTILCHPFRQRV